MEYKTIYNVGGCIPYLISMTWGMMYLEDVNSQVASEEDENDDNHQKQHLVEQQNQRLAKQKQQLTQKQAQGLVEMSGFTTLHVLYEGCYEVLTITRVENSQCTSIVDGKRTYFINFFVPVFGNHCGENNQK